MPTAQLVAGASTGGRQTYMGFPTVTHTTGSIVTYNVWQVNPATAARSVTSGPIQKQAYQDSNFSFQTGELCYLIRIDTTDGSELYLANVHPYQDCEVSDQLGFGQSVPLTISSDAVTVTGSHHTLIPEGGPGSGLDELHTINGGVDGLTVLLTRDGADNIRIKDSVGLGTGNINLPVDFTLNHQSDQIALVFSANAGHWIRLSFVNTA